eukprot:6268903-Ditylum_brightwellii.AAC.1
MSEEVGKQDSGREAPQLEHDGDLEEGATVKNGTVPNRRVENVPDNILEEPHPAGVRIVGMDTPTPVHSITDALLGPRISTHREAQ